MRKFINAIALRLGFVPQADFLSESRRATTAHTDLFRLEMARAKDRTEMFALRNMNSRLEDELAQAMEDLYRRNPLPPVASFFDLTAGDFHQPESMAKTYRFSLEPKRHAMSFATFPEEAEVYRRNAAGLARKMAKDFADAIQPDLEAALKAV